MISSWISDDGILSSQWYIQDYVLTSAWGLYDVFKSFSVMTLWFPNEVYMTTFWFQKELGMMSSWDSSEDIVRLSWFIHYVTLRYFSEVKRKVHDHVMVNSNDDLIIWCLEFPTAMLQSDVFKTSFESHIFLSSSDLWHHHDIIMTSNSQLG